MTIKAQHDTYLCCEHCGRESTTSFASSLRSGWERCCGHTMTLVRTDADIGQATRQAITEQLPDSVRAALGDQQHAPTEHQEVAP